MHLFTTCLNPHNTTKRFIKSLTSIFPNSSYYKRGTYSLDSIVQLCKSSNYSKLIIVHENKGLPSNMIISDLPFGPTFHFNLSSVLDRKQLNTVLASKGKNELAELKTEGNPILVLEGFEKDIGKKVAGLFSSMFPEVEENKSAKSVVSFFGKKYKIFFRNKKINLKLELVPENKNGFKNRKVTVLEEIGPRFKLKLYKITEGLLNEKYQREEFKLFTRKKNKDFL